MLNFNQSLVAKHGKGHAKVLAAAGSGKTTTMIERVKRLLDGKVSNEEVLSVMFNRDARDAYRGKLRKTYSKKECPPVFTFHGLGSTLLNRLVSLDLQPQRRLETSDYKLFMMAKDALSPWLVDIKGKRQVIMEFLSFVDLVKNALAAPIDVFSEYKLPGKSRFFLDGYKAFEKLREKEGILFFSDLIYIPVKYLKENKETAQRFSNQYEHIIIDEFQDISDIQMAMIQIIAGTRASVMVVGDDDQCIYSWRGAKPEYLISGVDKFFPNPKVFMLTETYRFGHPVAMAATHVIKNNTNRAPKLCTSNISCQPTEILLDVEMVGQPTVSKQITGWVESGRQLNETAILVRSFSQAVPVELALLTNGIPYTVEGGTALFDTNDIGALLCGLHVGVGTFHQLPENDKRKLLGFYIRFPALGLNRDVEYSLIKEVLSDLDSPAGALDSYTFTVKEKWIRDRIAKRARLWRNLEAMEAGSVGELIDYIVDESGVKHHIEYVAKSEEAAEDMWARYEAIIAYADHNKMPPSEFTMHLESIRKGVDAEGKRSDSVLITSVHRSKGLEWPFVIMPGLSQGKFPHIPRNSDQECCIEDERRLFYVAMTRAQEKLVMICPNDRRLKLFLSKGADQPPERIEADPASASQFIYESNIFLSQRADLMVSGKSPIPDGIASPDLAKAYIDSVNEKLRLQNAS